ncbi:Vms-1p [Parelaphostrongylus tenuis]|uniref:Vms-1p n=1 Tax=Parelaphostrongylus tenuis TaxID=148309 RepID=A0AAD5MJN3_PARTN|nr:Vms-1p [Parelaphostrongylus tenuis]
MVDREALIEHYRSQWHRFNARNALKGRPPVDEAQFEELGEQDREEDDATSSSTDSELSIEIDIPQNCRSSHIYFVHKGEVFSIYRCILNRDESTISAAVFSRPLNCAIFLLAGGHFAAGVFSGDKMIAHKAFHRYVVRAKQGGVQSVNDRSKGTAHSAGATLRRYNERALREDVMNVLMSWSAHLANTPLIFIRCASYQRVIFHEIDEGGFDRKDPRLRTIPFETKRPLVDEVQRVGNRAKVLVRKKRPDVQWNPEGDKSVERCSKEKKTDHLKPLVNIRDQPVEIDPWPSLDKNVRREIYALIKENNADALREFVNGRNEEEKDEVINFLSSFQFSSDSDTFLHMAARNGCSEVVEFLLEVGCDPMIKNRNDVVAYSVSANKAMKNVFIQFRSENPNRWNWTRCHIPEPTRLTDEQIVKMTEKKKEKKQRQKERSKMKKEAERKEAEEAAARAAFLALSDREKRAAAAEARMARLEGGPRCVQCGVIYGGPGFESFELRFCSPACVATYRRGMVSS